MLCCEYLAVNQYLQPAQGVFSIAQRHGILEGSNRLICRKALLRDSLFERLEEGSFESLDVNPELRFVHVLHTLHRIRISAQQRSMQCRLNFVS